jgi:hypothetical protein
MSSQATWFINSGARTSNLNTPPLLTAQKYLWFASVEVHISSQKIITFLLHVRSEI